MPAFLLLLAAHVAAADGLNQDGLLGGVVVNRSRDGQPMAGVRVVLEMKSDRDFVWLDETTTDAAGRFLFRGLLVSQYIQYRPSAQFAGIHYPGPRVHFAGERHTAAVTLAVRDVVHAPNPLQVRNHDVHIRSATGMLEVTESLTIENTSQSTYVGMVTADTETEPVTLQLSIPVDFQKVTFHSEFFGRSFAVRDRKLVTSIPWEPGRRTLEFTYFLRNTKERRVWERTLDLPTEGLQVRVVTAAPEQVTANLDRAATAQCNGYAEVLFASSTPQLPAQHVVHCTLGALPVPWMAYGKWCAACVLLALVIGSILHRWRRPEAAPPAIGVHLGPSSARRQPAPHRGAKRRGNKHLRRAA